MMRIFMMFFVILVFPLYAVAPDEILDDPALEAEARDISADLRCLVCQGESIDESDAGLARDVRLIVREQLVAGKNREEIIDFLVVRYGEFILLKPRFSGSGIFLWLIGPILLGLGGIVVLFVMRRGKKNIAAPLSDDEKTEIARLTGSDAS